MLDMEREDAAGGEVERAVGERVCQACRLRSEVEVLSWGPDRGNPTLMRQGRGPELTGRLAGAAGWRWWASVRAGLKEAVGAWWSRTRVKRRKASLGGVSWPVAAKPDSCWCRGRIGDGITRNLIDLPWEICWAPRRRLGRPEESEG